MSRKKKEKPKVKKIIRVKNGNKRLKTISICQKNCRTCYKFPCFAHSAIGTMIISHSNTSNGFNNHSFTNCQNWEGKTLRDYEIGKICPVCEGRGRIKKV